MHKFHLTSFCFSGQMGPRHFERFMLDQLTDGQLDWAELDEDYDNCVLVNGDKQEFIPIWKDRKKLVADLIKRYPKHEEGIKKFFDLMTSTSKSFLTFPMLKVLPYWIGWVAIKTGLTKFLGGFFHAYHEKTLDKVFQELFGNDEEIKTVLGYVWGDYGVEPSRVGYGMLSLLYGHYAKGGFYPVGGASEIAHTMIPVIEKSGGRVLVNAMVTDILLDENNTARGVRVKTSSGPIDIAAKMIISDAGVSNTFKKLLPKEVALKTQMGQMLEQGRIHPGVGTLQVFIGIKGSQAELQLPKKNLWIYYNENLEMSFHKFCDMELDTAAEAGDVPFLFVGFPSAKDPSYNDRFPGKSACTIVTVAPMKWFTQWEKDQIKKRGQDYQASKMRLARKCFELVADLYPQIRDQLDYIDAGSPLTCQYYINAYAGETYGLETDTERFAPDVVHAVRPRVQEINNLYLTGQDVLTCGFAAALYSAFLTSQTILQQTGETNNLLGDVKGLYKRCRKQQSDQPQSKVSEEKNGKLAVAEE